MARTALAFEHFSLHNANARRGRRYQKTRLHNLGSKCMFPLHMETTNSPNVGIIMGSQSDWSTMREAAGLLEQLKIGYEAKVVSAHRTPKRLYSYAETAEERGLEVIIAGAGGAAHLPGMVAALTHLPVLGVPVQSKALNGQDSLLSIVQMPAGVPVMTLAIGVAGAKNAALSAASILALDDKALRERLKAFRKNQTDKVLATELTDA